MNALEFRALLEALATTARAASDVTGLVAFGSTAAPQRADQWSDHDFAWITTDSDAAERYRNDLSWLPNEHRIALHVVEHHGGVKVVYDDGHRLEFGIAELRDFVTWAGGPAQVIVGDAAVQAAVEAVVAHRPGGIAEPSREAILFLTHLLAGFARAQRGEVLSASGLVRFEAVNHLLRALTVVAVADLSRLDPLDPRRRVEFIDEKLGQRLEAAVMLPVIAVARELLAIAEETLVEWAQFPRKEFAVARRIICDPRSGD